MKKTWLPVCSYCGRIRNGRDGWQRLEHEVTDHTDAGLTHGVCPPCYEKFVKPELKLLRTH